MPRINEIVSKKRVPSAKWNGGFNPKVLEIDYRYIQKKPYCFEIQALEKLAARLPKKISEAVQKDYFNSWDESHAFSEGNATIKRINNRLKVVGVSLSSSDETIKFVAGGLVAEFKEIGSDCYYKALRYVTLRYNVELDDIGGDDDTKKYLRIINLEWWERRLRIQQLRAREQIAREFGFVHKNANVYVTNETVKRVETRRARSWEILKTLDLVDKENEENRINMHDVAMGSVSNPKNKVNELYARNKGFDHYCQRMGHVAEFITLTCPSRFHAFHYSGHENKKFFNSEMPTPRDGQKYLNKIWKRIRAKFKRDGLQIYGMRSVEPHHDGTPHWHMVLYVRPEHRDSMLEIVRHHAIKEDHYELCDRKTGLEDDGKVKARFDSMEIDFSRGSGASYLFKYLLKNLVGIKGSGAGSVDFETAEFDDAGNLISGDETTKTASRVSVWASVWGIRQFQQVGGASVTVWRELRRIREFEAEQMEIVERVEKNMREGKESKKSDLAVFNQFNIWQAADVVEYEAFMILMGGADCPRSEQDACIYSEINENEQMNVYGEYVKRIKGILFLGYRFFFDDLILFTKLTNWKIEPAKPEKTNNEVLSKDQKIAAAVRAVDVLLNGFGAGFSPPWSSVNNCTV